MSGVEGLTGTVLRGRYQLDTRRQEATSGASATGTQQYSATDLSTNETVSVRLTELSRLVDPALGSTTEADALEMFERQCETAITLSHPTIETILDHGDATINGERYGFVVAVPLDGGSLREFLDRGRRLTPSQALVVGIDVCRALDAAARQGVIHGDIRPARLVFGLDRRVRLVGFGAPLRATDSLGVEQANYAAPELETGVQRSSTSDVYSLALTLVEAMTGVVPFGSDSVQGAFANRNGKLLPVSADFGALAQVIERAARPNPDERFSPREFGQALVKAAEQMPRPTPVDIVGTGLFDEDVAATDPTNPTARPIIAGDGPRSTKPAPPPVEFSPPRSEPGSPILIRTTPGLGNIEPSVPTGVSNASDPAPSGPLQLGLDPTGPVVLTVDELRELNSQDQTAQVASPKKSRWGLRIAIVALVIAVLGGGGLVAYNTVLNPANLVPKLTGIDEGEARNQISRYGWKVIIKKERSDDVETGQVIRTDPIEGVSLKKRDSIVLYVSEGKTLSTLVDVSGKTTEEARAALEGIGLVVSLVDTPDEAVPAGTVISWSVPDQPTLKAGDSLMKGTTVDVRVSTGPALRDVPDLTGLSLDEATAKLAELGLKAKKADTDMPHPTIAFGKVVSQVPAAASKAPRDSEVLVTLSAGQKTTLIPTIYNRDFATVKQRLEDAGMVIGKVTGNKSRGLKSASINGKVVKNFSRVIVGQTVDLVFP